MSISVRFAALALSGMFAAASAHPAQATAPAAGQDGYQLLNRLVVLLAKAASPGGAADAGASIVALARDMKAAHHAGRIDDLFAVRYSRVLSAVRQGILSDPEVLYWPMYRFEMMQFIEERTGKMPEWKDVMFHVQNHGGSGVGLALLADAVLSEVVSLHIHLENASRRAEILKGYMDRSMKELR